jgi:NADH:ubiquinone oxidoreductase subunit F (NADH-binding)
MTSIEGHRGEPRPRPPFPAVKGLFGKPTILNNVETFANIAWIINNGPEAFAALGTEKSKGTKVFALAER